MTLKKSVQHLLNQLMTAAFQANVNMSGKGSTSSLYPLNELICEKFPEEDKENVNNAIRYTLHLARKTY